MKFFKILVIFLAFTLAESLILNCNYKQSSRSFIGAVYECEAKLIRNLIVDRDQSNVTDVTQAHLQGKTNNDVVFLDISHQNFPSFPKGIEKFFSNLKGIYAISNNLKAITKDDLKVFTNLEYISFYNNDITMLESDLFSLSPNLQYVNFGQNKIRNIGRNIFKPLKNLKELYFHDGKMCINEYATKPDEIESLISNLFVFCPPSYEMIMRDIWSDEDFLRQIDARIESKVDVLVKQINYLERKIQNT